MHGESGKNSFIHTGPNAPVFAWYDYAARVPTKKSTNFCRFLNIHRPYRVYNIDTFDSSTNNSKVGYEKTAHPSREPRGHSRLQRAGGLHPQEVDAKDLLNSREIL